MYDVNKTQSKNIKEHRRPNHYFIAKFINSLEFADETKVREIVKKYSSFVGSSIALNGTKSNDLRPGKTFRTAYRERLFFK